MSKPRKTLAQMQREAQGAEPMQIGGKPADVCPYCGAGMFVNGKRPGENVDFRYVWCRNEKCVDANGNRRRFRSRQERAVLIEEIGTNELPSSSGRSSLTLHKETA